MSIKFYHSRPNTAKYTAMIPVSFSTYTNLIYDHIHLFSAVWTNFVEANAANLDSKYSRQYGGIIKHKFSKALVSSTEYKSEMIASSQCESDINGQIAN